MNVSGFIFVWIECLMTLNDCSQLTVVGTIVCPFINSLHNNGYWWLSKTLKTSSRLMGTMTSNPTSSDIVLLLSRLTRLIWVLFFRISRDICWTSCFISSWKIVGSESEWMSVCGNDVNSTMDKTEHEGLLNVVCSWSNWKEVNEFCLRFSSVEVEGNWKRVPKQSNNCLKAVWNSWTSFSLKPLNQSLSFESTILGSIINEAIFVFRDMMIFHVSETVHNGFWKTVLTLPSSSRISSVKPNVAFTTRLLNEKSLCTERPYIWVSPLKEFQKTRKSASCRTKASTLSVWERMALTTSL